MRLTCPLSGINYSTDSGTGSAKAIHPIFQLSLDSLIRTNLAAATAQKLSYTDLHLFGAAILHKLPIERWSVPLISAKELEPDWNRHIVQLAQTAARLDARIFPELPQLCISHETNDLRTLGDYLKSLNLAIDEATNFSPADKDGYDLTTTTNRIYEILRGTNEKLKHRKLLPQLLAKWAMMVSSFPVTDIYVDYWDEQKKAVLTKKMVTRTYWKSLIIKACSEDKLGFIRSEVKDSEQADYEELLAFCETHIPYGSLHTDTLFGHLRNAIDILQEFKPKKVDAAIWIQELIADSKSAEQQTTVTVTYSDKVAEEHHEIKQPLAKPARSEPKRNEFPNSISWLKAKLAWQSQVLEYRDKQGSSN